MRETNSIKNRIARTPRRLAAGFFGLLLAGSISVYGQSYSIDWFKVAGGGGTSTGGVYSVSGTIGQSDAGTMSGGNFTLQGGFWSGFVVVQTPGAPWLSILRTTTNTVVVSWPAPAEGWVLERTNALTAASIGWPQVPPPYQTQGDKISVTFTNGPTVGTQFFRLHKP